MEHLGDFGDGSATAVSLTTSPTEQTSLVATPSIIGEVSTAAPTVLTLAPDPMSGTAMPQTLAVFDEGIRLPGGHASTPAQASPPSSTALPHASARSPAIAAPTAPAPNLSADTGAPISPSHAMATTAVVDTSAVTGGAMAAIPAVGSTPATTTGAGGSHMTITLVDAPGTALSSAAQSALNYAASYLDNLITNPIDVTLGVTVANLGGGVVAEGGATYYQMGFSQVENHIHAAAPDFVLPSLPKGTSSEMYISKAEALAWGSTNNPGMAGGITLNSAYMNDFNFSTNLSTLKSGGGMDFVGVALHELTHALGRVPEGVFTQGSIIMPLDLFDYTKSGSLVSDGHYSYSSVPTNYFSVDGGVSLLNQFAGVSSDPSDWSSGIAHDAFNAFVPANYATLSPVDATLMNALGFDVNYAALPCFAEGTRILTTRGEVAVEALEVGDRLVLAGGGNAPLRWIGRRTLDIARQPEPGTILPVLIRAGAIGDGLPVRDLVVSPDHAIFLDGHLIPAKALITLDSIRQLWCPRITYFHLELPAHGVIFAEGLAAESYLDTGNRSDFIGVGTQVSGVADRVAGSCASLVEAGPVVEAVRRRILARTQPATTADPDLRIERLVNGGALIRSRRVVPGFATPDPRDRRCLGIKIAALAADGLAIPLDHPALAQGWHDVEEDGRWTDGGAVIPPELCAGKLEIIVAGSLDYPLQP